MAFEVSDCSLQCFLNHPTDVRAGDIRAATTSVTKSVCWHCAAADFDRPVSVVVDGSDFGAFCSAECAIGFLRDPLNSIRDRDVAERETLLAWGATGPIVPECPRALLSTFGGPLEPRSAESRAAVALRELEVPNYFWLYVHRKNLESLGARVSAFEVHRNASGGISRPDTRETPPVESTPSGAPPMFLNILADLLIGREPDVDDVEPPKKPKKTRKPATSSASAASASTSLPSALPSAAAPTSKPPKSLPKAKKQRKEDE